MRSLLEVMVEPLSRSLASAPVEEEDITPDTPRRWTEPMLRSLAAKAFLMNEFCGSSA